MSDMIRAVVVKPGEPAVAQDFDGSLQGLQAQVGGLIQTIYPFDDNVAIVCNDEGKILGMPLNRALRDEAGEVYDVIAGNFLVLGLSEDNFASLTLEQEQKYLEIYKTPERFGMVNGKVVVSPFTDKMSFNEFRESATASLKKRFERDGIQLEIVPRYISKPNKSYEGIMVALPNNHVSMCVDLEPAYAQLKPGNDIEYATAPLYETIHNNIYQMAKYDMADQITDYSWAKDHLAVDVLSREQVGDYLTGVPHTEIGADLVATYRIVIDDSASVVVNNSMRKQYGVSEEQLHADALISSEKQFPVKMQPLSAFMGEALGKPAPYDPGVWICTAENRTHGGAGVIAYSSFPDEVASKITDGDYYILPSSLHEVLVIPDNGGIQAAALDHMVKSVNAREVQPEDILADRAYFFDAEKKELMFATQHEEQVKTLGVDKIREHDTPKRKGR